MFRPPPSVLSRAAAAQVDSRHLISVDHAPGGVTYTNAASQQQRIVSSKLDSSGQPYFQIKTEVSGSAYKQTTVEYQHQVWSTFTTSSRITVDRHHIPCPATANR